MRTRPIAFFVVVILLASIYPFIATGTLAQGTNPGPDSVYLPIVIKPAPTATPVPTPTGSPAGDIDAPKLLDWDFSSVSIDTGDSDKVITVTAHIVDDLSGISNDGYVRAYFFGPSGQNATVGFHYPHTVISGTAQDGVHQAKIFLPQFSATGRWEIDYIYLVDRVGNKDFLYSRDLSAQGLTFFFMVTNN